MFFQNHIFCCTNRREAGHTRGCCAEKDGEQLRDYMKMRVKELGIAKTRVNNSGCLDRCELGPCIVIYPEGIWYSPKTKADIDEIIELHLQQGKIVERLTLPEA
ncbi:MAG: (2Fe-2S) ferredoxin domain-containing protein [Alphaproteobacteria bacterium]|nr:(2Fe-2S) ferredoxin domain-containing protein [Alphaproteobacteria bacterium]